MHPNPHPEAPEVPETPVPETPAPETPAPPPAVDPNLAGGPGEEGGG